MDLTKLTIKLLTLGKKLGNTSDTNALLKEAVTMLVHHLPPNCDVNLGELKEFIQENAPKGADFDIDKERL